MAYELVTGELPFFDRDPIACSGDFPLRSALALMRERQQASLVVLDGEGTIAGVVSLAELLDLLEHLVPEETDGPEPEYVRQVRGEDNGE